MEELNLNKKGGEILSSAEWNRMVSALNTIIQYCNNFPDKISAFENDSEYITNQDLENLASKQYVGNALQNLVDSGVMAGPAGHDGTTPHIDPVNKHWIIGNTDTNVVAEGTNGQNGQDGVSPSVTITAITGGNRVVITDSTDSYTFDVMDGQNGQNGQDGTTPHIDPTSKHWMIGLTDTGVLAEGQQGISAYQSYVNTTSDNPVLTEQEWEASLHARQLQSDWNQSDNTQGDFIKNKPTLFSGSYTDLTDKPTIPQIWQGTQAQYEALSPNYDSNTIYIITTAS